MKYSVHVVSSRTKPLRRLCTMVGLLTMASVFITYQLLRTVDNGLYSAHGPRSGHAAIDRAGAGGKIFGRSLNMHRVSGEIGETDAPKTQSVLSRLLKLEERLLEPRQNRKVAIIGKMADEKVDLLKATLQKMGRDVQDYKDLRWVDGQTVVQGNYSLVVCLDEGSDLPCPGAGATRTDHHLKASRIPEMAVPLTNPSTLCEIAKVVNKYKGSESCPCFSTNVDNDTRFAAVFDEKSDHDTSVVVSRQHGVIPTSRATTEQLTAEDSVYWHIPGQPVQFPRGSLLRMNIIITSYLPLRVYMEPLLTSAALYGSTSQLSTHVDDLLQYMSETYGLRASTQWWSTAQAVVFRHLVYTEATVAHRGKRCRRCFQRLQLTLICSSIRHCYIIQVTEPGLPDDPQPLSALLSMTLSGTSVAMDVAHALENADVAGFKACGGGAGDPTSCLTDDDLIYLLDDRRETLAAGDLIKLYPGTDGWRYTPFLGYIERHSGPSGYSGAGGQTTRGLHPRLMVLQAHYTSLDARQQDLFDVSIDTEEMVERRQLSYSYDSSDTAPPQRAPCSRDPADYGQLLSLHTDPPVPLRQTGSAGYQAVVDYDVIVIKIWAFARSCLCHVTFDNKYSSDGPRNQTIGLGDNHISILVIDTSQADPRLVRIYTLIVTRQLRGRGDLHVTGHNLQTCALKQDCSLRFDPASICGLYNTNVRWTDVTHLRRTDCQHGDHAGSWMVPCESCVDQDSCYWQQATWQPERCRYKHVTSTSLSKCVHDKKFLFIGDSTNRGILNYMIQQLNGSIWNWDKTHSMKIYRNINNVNAVFAFAYYPHFWLPPNHRPKFYKVIYQLIKNLLPLANNANTVLVVGGVHWLARQHIDIIVTALQRKGLSNITVVVKGLGAGFHLPIDGVRYVAVGEQQKLAAREQEVMDYAKTKGFRVAATFNMTMARYKDFVQGKCACHFHKVTPVSEINGVKMSDRYQIDGDINQAYSQIVLNQICRPRWT